MHGIIIVKAYYIYIFPQETGDDSAGATIKPDCLSYEDVVKEVSPSSPLPKEVAKPPCPEEEDAECFTVLDSFRAEGREDSCSGSSNDSIHECCKAIPMELEASPVRAFHRKVGHFFLFFWPYFILFLFWFLIGGISSQSFPQEGWTLFRPVFSKKIINLSLFIIKIPWLK